MSAPGWLRSEWLAVRVQLALGLIFIAAALPKLKDPPTFAKNVWAHDLLPGSLVNLQAILLPGVELIVGLALVIGVQRRAAAGLSALMLVMFIAALTWNAWIAENPVNCSCFELHPAPKTCSQLLAEMKWDVLRDIGMLVLAAHVWWRRGPRSDVSPTA